MARQFEARFAGTCRTCNKAINIGDRIVPGSHARSGKKTYIHAACGANEETERKPEAFETQAPPIPVEDNEAPESFKVPEPIPFEAEDNEAPMPEVSTGNGLANVFPALAEALQPYMAGKVSKKDVRDVVVEELDKVLGGLQETINEAVRTRAPRVVEIRTAEETRRVEGVHSDFASILETVQAGRDVGYSCWLHGAPGSGKSTIARQVAEALGLPFYLLTLAPMSPPSGLVGYGDANGRYVESDAYKAYTQGGVLCVEEIDNANDGVLTAFNAALANGHGSWPVVGTVAKHPDFVLIACANTAGLGPTRAFPSRRRLDAAFRDRFVFLDVGYDLDLEERLCLAANPQGTSWLVKVRMLREWCATNAPEVFVTPRSSMYGATLLRLGRSMRAAASASVFRGVEADLVDRACKAVNL